MRPIQLRLFVLLTTVLIAGACRKESAPTPAKSQEWLLVKKVTAEYNSSRTTDTTTVRPLSYQNTVFYPLSRSQQVYQYDAQRRLTYVQSRNPDRPDYTYEWGDVSLEYAGNQLIYTNRRVYPLSPATYDLNSQGYITQYNTYDKEGYLVFRQDGPNATVKQTIAGGNVVQKIAQNSVSRVTTTYEYDLTRPGLPHPEMAFWGRPSRNLLVKTTEIYESFSGVPSIWPNRHVTTYRYEFDELGRPRQQTAFVERSLLPDPTVMWRELRVSTLEYQ